MALPFKVVVKDKKFAYANNLEVNHPYQVDAMDTEGYIISHPFNDMNVNIPYKYGEEVYK